MKLSFSVEITRTPKVVTQNYSQEASDKEIDTKMKKAAEYAEMELVELLAKAEANDKLISRLSKAPGSVWSASEQAPKRTQITVKDGDEPVKPAARRKVAKKGVTRNGSK